jgi:hypothetical protein
MKVFKTVLGFIEWNACKLTHLLLLCCWIFQVFESGNKMHLIHSVALLAVPLTRRPKLVCTILCSYKLFEAVCLFYSWFFGGVGFTLILHIFCDISTVKLFTDFSLITDFFISERLFVPHDSWISSERHLTFRLNVQGHFVTEKLGQDRGSNQRSLHYFWKKRKLNF